ncbi:hypothetical protein [Rhodococcus sp. 27YEA15]|uniref:hypothetical protein n=1 Tax=Rhodococcus sp. 27YEA15 TaxID=3156259 RepID=UPI003C7E9E69
MVGRPVSLASPHRRGRWIFLLVAVGVLVVADFREACRGMCRLVVRIRICGRPPSVAAADLLVMRAVFPLGVVAVVSPRVLTAAGVAAGC